MKTRGLEQVLDKFVKRKQVLKNEMRPAHKAAAIVLDRWVSKNMDAEGGNHKDSKLKWPPLAQSTIDQRIKENRIPIQMLKRTGQLRQRFELGADNQKGWVRNRVKYSMTHERGDPVKAIPRRKIFPTIEHGREIVLPAYREYIKRNVIKK